MIDSVLSGLTLGIAPLAPVLLGGSEPSTGSVWLMRIHPAEGMGEMFQLASGTLTIGRDATCDVYLPDDSVSRRHGEFEVGDDCVLTDLDSTNGIYVNDERIKSRRLSPGDRVRLGTQIFRFLGADRSEAECFEAVYRLMTTDGLTQAFNKRYLLEVAEREVCRARRTARPLSLVIFEVDHFKRINDTYGHLAGDEVLSELCRRARGVLRQDEVLARFGGEEFVLLLVETSIAEARQVADRLRLAVANEPFHSEHAKIEVTISLGLAETTAERPLAVADLLAAADSQLYAAKNAGRNRICG